MPKDAKDKGYIRQLFSLCLFQLHFASHIGFSVPPKSAGLSVDGEYTSTVLPVFWAPGAINRTITSGMRARWSDEDKQGKIGLLILWSVGRLSFAGQGGEHRPLPGVCQGEATALN